MPLSVAKEAIGRHFNNSDSFEEIEIAFHGGEPIVQFDLIRSLSEWVWSQSWPKPHLIFATTNGTLVHGEIQDWMASNKDRFYLCLSLDGTPEMHDANRSNSFCRIDVSFFQRTWPDQPVKMTVSGLTLPRIAEGVIHLHGLGFKVEAGFAYGLDWSNSKNLEVLAAQLAILSDYYLKNPRTPPCSFMAMDFAVIGMASDEVAGQPWERENHARKWCGIGSELFAVDVDGAEYPCHLFLPFTAREKSDLHRRFDFADCELLRDDRCKDCVIQPICPTCYASNLLETGSPAARNPALCSLHKLRALASSSMQAQMILRRSEFSKFSQMEDQELMFTIMGIESVQSSIRL